MKFQVGIARFYWDYRDDGERHVIHTRMIIIIFYLYLRVQAHYGRADIYKKRFRIVPALKHRKFQLITERWRIDDFLGLLYHPKS